MSECCVLVSVVFVNKTYFGPCVHCLNQIRQDLGTMRDHLFIFSLSRVIHFGLGMEKY